MKSFDYSAPTQIVFGAGRVKDVGKITATYGKKAMLVTEPAFPALQKLYDTVKKSLSDAGVECLHYDGVIPNPTTSIVTKGADMAKAHGVDVVIGLGGGSAMDTAKAIAVESTHPGCAWDYNCHTNGPSEKTLPIIAIGTTAGTGSQVTQCAVITKTSDQDKSAIWHKNIFPRIAIVDPEITMTMPMSVTAQTGFDAFCHSFEAYLSINSNVMADGFALQSIALIAENLPKVLANGTDLEARSKMSWADTLGGLSNSSAGVTLPHGLGMQVGGCCPHVTHGQALAAFYPAFTRYTYSAAVEKFATVGRILQPSLLSVSDETAAEKCCTAIDDFLKEIGMWMDFESLNVSRDDIRKIADRGQVLGDYANNPRVATIPEMYDLLMSCYHRN